MKHILQWKFIGIMFISLICGVSSMAITEYYFFGKRQDMTAEEAQMAASDYSIWLSMLFIFVTVAVFLVLSRKIIKRIERMSHNVELITEGKMTELAPDSKWDELGNLSRNISEMAEKIEASLEKEREMVCSVAHDLRTPVTSIQGYARLLEKSGELSQENKNYASIIEQKSVNLAEQIGELLEYSILQFEEKEYTFETLSLKCLVEQVLIELVPMMDQKQMTFSIKGNDKALPFECNQLLMVRLFENLLTNCIRYGKEGGDIEIALAESEEMIYISIKNEGNLLSQDEKEHLFDAFYQGKDAKHYQTQSKGLGLAISKKIVMLHGGNIGVSDDKENKKVIFNIEFPKVERQMS